MARKQPEHSKETMYIIQYIDTRFQEVQAELKLHSTSLNIVTNYLLKISEHLKLDNNLIVSNSQTTVSALKSDIDKESNTKIAEIKKENDVTSKTTNMPTETERKQNVTTKKENTKKPLHKDESKLRSPVFNKKASSRNPLDKIRASKTPIKRDHRNNTEIPHTMQKEEEKKIFIEPIDLNYQEGRLLTEVCDSDINPNQTQIISTNEFNPDNTFENNRRKESIPTIRSRDKQKQINCQQAKSLKREFKSINKKDPGFKSPPLTARGMSNIDIVKRTIKSTASFAEKGKNVMGGMTSREKSKKLADIKTGKKGTKSKEVVKKQGSKVSNLLLSAKSDKGRVVREISSLEVQFKKTVLSTFETLPGQCFDLIAEFLGEKIPSFLICSKAILTSFSDHKIEENDIQIELLQDQCNQLVSNGLNN